MNFQKPTLALGLALAGLSAFASVEWLEKEYDFGRWSEADGLRDGKVRLVNHGPEAVVIRRVRPSCGCTGVDWPQKPIAPGDTAEIRFNYNPEGRPGAFEKTIKVFLDDAEQPEVIRIKGTVIGAERSLRHRFPVEVGPLRLSERVIDLGDVVCGTVKNTFISAYNQSTEPVTPTLTTPRGDTRLPIELRLLPPVAQPGETQTITIFFDSSKAPQQGVSESVSQFCAGDSCTDIRFRVNVVPATENLTAEQLKTAPLAKVAPSTIELPKIERKKKSKIQFSITNEGKSPLEVRRIYSTDRAISIKGYPSRLKPGKSGTVTAELDPAVLDDADVASGVIDIITNDPLRPVISVRYVGRILK